MNKSRDLNFFDIWLHRKDFLWGKDYFGLLDRGKLVGSILYEAYRGSDHVIEILKIENRSEELLRRFSEKYARKYKIKYFVIELDEKLGVDDISLLNRCGFKRYMRNYYYELRAEDFSPSNEVKMICREAEYEDVEAIMELDCSSQALEYRDYLFATKRYIRDKLSDYYVFADPHDMTRPLVFVRKCNDRDNSYEFVTNQAGSAMLPHCLEAFAERNLRFEKNSYLHFAVASSHKEMITELERNYDLVSVSQLLILESAPREHSAQLSPGFAFRPQPSI